MDTLLFIGFLIVVLLIWQYMRDWTANNKTWRALLSAYKTSETNKTLSGKYLDIVFYYFDKEYVRRIYKFYETSEGLLITPSSQFFLKQNVLVPWSAIDPTELQQRDIGTMQRLEIANTGPAKIDIIRTDFLQYIKPYLVSD
ncbi:MAG: hypothetical protein KTR30_19715 [Saprospiraceae bacterium]|nr:hypothetical protein [Saprospiraceae bacterium]